MAGCSEFPYGVTFSMTYLSFVLAVLAAVTNAISNVLQRRTDRDEPDDRAMRPQLVLHLVRQPLWLAGLGAVIASFLLLAAALDFGRLAAVDPIIVLELPLTLVLATRVLGGRLTGREWWAIVALTVGLAGLIGLLAPEAGNGGRASPAAWIVASGVTVGVLAVAVAAAVGRAGPWRAVLLGAATGVAFGLTAAFMKGMTSYFRQGPIGVLTAWQTYAMVASGIGGLFLAQNALQAGRLLFAQPGMTLLDPLVSILWGVVVFHESVSGGVMLAFASVSGVVMAAGAVVLARSPLLRDDPDEGIEPQRSDKSLSSAER